MKSKNKPYTAFYYYNGEIAKIYNDKRIHSQKWKREQKILHKIINSFKDKSTILDLPIGTGRFLPFYKNKSHTIVGIDISDDMLSNAKSYSTELGIKDTIKLINGDAEKIPLKKNSVDHVVCIRLLNLVPFEVLENIIDEFIRVSRKEIIIQTRLYQKQSIKFLLFKILKDYRTNLNKFIYYSFIRFFKKNKNDNLTSNANYFLHPMESFYQMLQKKNIVVSECFEVDNAVDLLQSKHKPLLIFKCSQKLDDE